jgi:membrane-associated protein
MLDFLTMLLHIDKTLGVWVDTYGAWIYLVLFLIIFAETGLVVVPFLPGDSLLFIAGAFAATGAMDPAVLVLLLLVAAVLGNTVNYYVGRFIGPKVFSHNIRFLDREALLRTHAFYEKHGGKTLVLARFIPVIRTFAPFVAGVGTMSAVRFQLFNVIGATLWVTLLVLCGYFFGNLPVVRDHLSTIVLVGMAGAVVPVVLGGLWKAVRRPKQA